MKPVTVSVPLETEVIENHRNMVVGTSFEDGRGIFVDMDVRRNPWRRLLGLPKKAKIHWADVREVEIKELSSLLWPLHYRLTYGDGWYKEKDGKRHYFALQPHLHGIDLSRRCTTVALRAAVLLAVMGGVGLRTVCWLMQVLFHLEVTKSTLNRWVTQYAAQLPDAAEMARLMHSAQPIREAHFDEIFAKGQRPKKCTLVLRDEHGRIFAAREVEQRDTDTVVEFLEKVKGWNLDIGVFYVDGCDAYKKAIPKVFPEAIIQYDYFHVIQNIWKKLRKLVVERRKTIKQRGEDSDDPKYSKRLINLAKRIWKKRGLFLKNDENMNEEEREELLKIIEADPCLNKVRRFAEAVWAIFEKSTTQEEAEKALEELKRRPEVKPQSVFQKALDFLDERFFDMTAYLRHPDIKRNSLAETGIRCLRRLENGHDGFRGPEGLDRYLRIYQAIKYCGMSVHRSTFDDIGCTYNKPPEVSRVA